MLNSKTILATILAGGLSLSGTAMAHNGGHGAINHGHGTGYGQHYDRPGPNWGRVVKVRPVYRSVRVAYPHQVCKGHGRRGYRHSSATPEIFGAIVGAAIGNQFGGGRGKDLATAAGAMLGASVAHDRKHPHWVAGRGCWVETRYRFEERLVGYKVKYRYGGRLYRTRTASHPGRWIRAARRHALLD